jgi:methylenetetrahydrofolate dehydrogenase (NADP+)/methenyltetrahydrofolate cyclohydrolase/formyltetrahydrofolate synthetase
MASCFLSKLCVVFSTVDELMNGHRNIRNKVKQEIIAIKAKHPQYTPCLAVVQVGAKEDSSVYVRMKEKAAHEIGIAFIHKKLPESISQIELLREVKQLNDSSSVHGIIVQMPLPSHIDEGSVIEAIDPRKDVDG